MTDEDPGAERHCPVCGNGVLADIDFMGNDLFQDAQSRQVDVYSCGHEVDRARLDSADADRLDVERRNSEEATAPTPTEEES